MKPLFILITLSVFCFMGCEEGTLETFEEVYVISNQSEADMVKGIIGDAIFDLDDPERGFKGNIEIVNSSNGGDPIVDLSLFENYRFWLGSIKIESDDIEDLSFLKNIEQIRGGLEIVNCSNLKSIDLPNLAVIMDRCIIVNNPLATSIDLGSELLENVYDELLIDSLIIMDNESLTVWEKPKQPLDFIFHTTIINNPKLTSLESFSELSMPNRDFNLELFGATVNADGVNPGIDSLTMPKRTTITVSAPDNDFSWLSRAKNRISFQTPEFTRFNGEPFEDSILVDFIEEFTIIGDIEIDEVCDLKGAIMATPLVINSTSAGLITETILEDNCPE